MPGKKLSEKDLAAFRAQLELMLGVLNGDIDRLETEALGDGERPELQGDEGGVYAIEFNLDLLERDETTKSEVRDAISRVDEGTFGRCERCRVWIKKDRLRAVPHARNCIECQRALEAESA